MSDFYKQRRGISGRRWKVNRYGRSVGVVDPYKTALASQTTNDVKVMQKKDPEPIKKTVQFSEPLESATIPSSKASVLVKEDLTCTTTMTNDIKVLKNEMVHLSEAINTQMKAGISRQQSLEARLELHNNPVYAVSLDRNPMYEKITAHVFTETPKDFIDKGEKVLLLGRLLQADGSDTTWRIVKRVYDNGDVAFFYTPYSKGGKILFYNFSV
jgi:hypothetical protein